MPIITLPDGAQHSFSEPITAYEIAQSIRTGLARSAPAARIDDGFYYDFGDMPLQQFCELLSQPTTHH
jgi:hypothetical protein